MKRSLLMLALLAAFGLAHATKPDNPPNECGNHGNNCNPGGGAGGAGGDATANAGAIGVGVGIGIGTGGNASAVAGGGSATIGDIRNTNTANGGAVVGSGNSNNDNTNIAVGGAGGQGGAGGKGGEGGTGIGIGGSAHQGQAQGQDQSQKQGQGQSQGQVTDVDTRTSTSTSTAQGQSQDASSQNSNDNRSNASGNSTSVGGQSVSFNSTYVAKRNAPGAYAPSVYPTATCQKSVSLGFSGLWGGGSTGMSYSDKECQTTVLAQNLAAIGMTDTACDVLKTSDTWARAVKANPELANVSCRLAPPAAPAAPPVVEYTVPREARGAVDSGSKWRYHTVIVDGKQQ